MSSGETKQDVNSAHKVTDDILIEEINKRIHDNKYMGNYVNNVDKRNGTSGPKDGLYHLVYDGKTLTPSNMDTGGYKTDYDAAQQIKKAWADKVNDIYKKMSSGVLSVDYLSAPPESGQVRGRGRGAPEAPRGRGTGAPVASMGRGTGTPPAASASISRDSGLDRYFSDTKSQVWYVNGVDKSNKNIVYIVPGNIYNPQSRQRILNDPNYQLKYFYNNSYYAITGTDVDANTGTVFAFIKKIS